MIGISPMQQKSHQRYYVHFIISEYLSSHQQSTLAIDAEKILSAAVLICIFTHIWIYIPLSSKHARTYQQQDGLFYLRVFFSNPKSIYLKYLKYLQSRRKFELSISKYMRPFVFRSGAGSYIFIFLVTYLNYILFLLVCDNFPLTSKKGRC